MIEKDMGIVLRSGEGSRKGKRRKYRGESRRDGEGRARHRRDITCRPDAVLRSCGPSRVLLVKPDGGHARDG